MACSDKIDDPTDIPQDGIRKMTAEQSRDPDVLRLHAEELSVKTEQVETGRVRVQVVTRDHEELVDIPLVRETHQIERIPIGREVDAIPPVREDGDTTIMSVVEEVLVLQRKLILKEELHIKKVRTTERYQERVGLKRQEAVVTRNPSRPAENV